MPARHPAYFALPTCHPTYLPPCLLATLPTHYTHARDQARLEVFDSRVLVRPCPSATWSKGLGAEAWGRAALSYVGAEKGGEKGAAKGGDAEGAWRGEGLAEIEEEAGDDEEMAAGVGDEEAGGAAARWALRPQGLGFALALRPGSQGQLGAFPEQARLSRYSTLVSIVVSMAGRLPQAKARVSYHAYWRA